MDLAVENQPTKVRLVARSKIREKAWRGSQVLDKGNKKGFPVGKNGMALTKAEVMEWLLDDSNWGDFSQELPCIFSKCLNAWGKTNIAYLVNSCSKWSNHPSGLEVHPASNQTLGIQ